MTKRMDSFLFNLAVVRRLKRRQLVKDACRITPKNYIDQFRDHFWTPFHRFNILSEVRYDRVS